MNRKLIYQRFMGYRLHLCRLLCCLSLLWARPAALYAAPLEQAERAILQLENQSSQPLAICEVFAVRLPAEVVLDLQEQMELGPGESKQFFVPPGRYRLLVSDCEQNVLVQQQDLLVTNLVALPLSAQASSVSPHPQLQQSTSREVMLQIHNQARQTICYIYIANVTATTADEGQGFEVNIATSEVYSIALVPGNYNLGLLDCDGNALLFKRDLPVKQDHKFLLSQADVNRTGCDALNQEGETAYRQSLYQEALAAFQAALVCFREVGNRVAEGTMINNIGAVYRAQGLYGEALASFEQALAIRCEVGDRAGEGRTLTNIGLVYYSQGRYGEALVSYEQALAILQKIRDREGEGATLNNMGGVYYSQGRYGEALALYERALAIRREIGDRAGEGATLANMGGLQDAQGRYGEALANYEQALTIGREIGDRAGEGTILNNIGRVYDAQGRHSEALARFEQALAIRREVGDRAGEGATLIGIGLVYYSQGRYSEALARFEQALAIGREIGDREGEGTTLTSIGLVYYSQGRYREALARFEQRMLIAQEIGDREGEGTTLNNIGAVYRAQGRYGEALACYEQALAIGRQIGDRAGEGTTLNNIGLVYYSQGRYGEALASYKQALAIGREIGDREGEGTILNNIGRVYDAQGRYREALANYEQALTIVREVGNREGEGTTLNNIGLVYDAQGRYGEALASYKQALAIQREIGDRAGEGTTLNNIGLVYYNQGRYREALASYEQALIIVREMGDRAGEGITLNNIGLVYYSQGRYGEALASYEQALTIVFEVGNRVGEGTTLNHIGLVYDAQGRYGEALARYVAGLNTLEAVRIDAGSDQARISFVEGYTFAYDRVIALSYQQGAVAQAFWYSERGRARTLLDLLATGQVQLSDNEAATLLSAEQQAYAERQSAQDTLAKARAANPPDPAWVNKAKATLQAAEAAYEEAAAAITQHSDQLAGLIPGRQEVPQLPEVQALLDADTTLLSYWTLEDNTLAFVITAKDAAIVELPGVTAQSVLTLTESLYQWGNLDNPYPLPLRQLYQALIAPLSDKVKTPHLAIIPHQTLHYVPFAALVDEANGKHYLGEEYTLSILPSASILPYLQQNAKAAQANHTGAAVVFGDPASNEPGLSRLHYAAAEAGAVAELLHTTVLTDTAASEATLQQVAHGARIVHLAAHGEYNQANALYSAIYLAPSSPLTPTQSITATDGLPTVDTSLDGRLETHEIFGLPLEGNDLVVLSACQTNLGNLSRGDELVGLTRAFFFAKSPTVISSLWNVDDVATEALMVAFYKYWLEEGMSKAGALQAAQAEVRADRRWVSPFYWAGFVLNGDPGHSGQKGDDAEK